jgi:transketolase C-terminal domain/subunit
MTHLALEDVAIIPAQPRLRVIAPADPERADLWRRYDIASTA